MSWFKDGEAPKPKLVKLCIHCKYYHKLGSMEPRCNRSTGKSLVDGEDIVLRNSCDFERTVDSLCGKDGRYFQAK